MPIRPGDRAKTNIDMTPYVPSVTTEYSEQYKKDLFLVWYQANRPRGKKFSAIIPKDEYGRVPGIMIVQKWMREQGWQAKANEMDGEVWNDLRKIAIEKKVQMHERHAEIGKELAELGIEWLESHNITTATEAARIVELGTRLEKENTGGAQALTEVSKLSNRKLGENIQKLLASIDESELDVIEGELVKEEEE